MTFTTGTRKLFTTLIAAGTVALAFSAPAPAATTFGSDLTALPAYGNFSCPLGGPAVSFCTYVPGIPAPATGVIVRWRVRTAQAIPGPVGVLAPRVVRQTGTNTGLRTGARVPINVTGVTTTDTRLPIAAGEFFGVDIGDPFGAADPKVPYMFADGSGGSYYKPGILDGGTAPAASYSQQLLANADIEADADNDGFGDETQDGCPSVASRQAAPCVTAAPATATCKVPKLKGLTKSKAKAALVKAGCKLGKTSKKKSKKGKKGRATKQSPAAGKVVAAGTAVKLTLKK